MKNQYANREISAVDEDQGWDAARILARYYANDFSDGPEAKEWAFWVEDCQDEIFGHSLVSDVMEMIAAGETS